MNEENPDWLNGQRGVAPEIRWSFSTEAPLVSLDLANESGDLLAADTSGGLYRLDSRGQFVSLTRGHRNIRKIAFCDTGSAAVILTGDSVVSWLDENLEVQWSIELHEVCLDVAIDPYGQHLAVSLADGNNIIYSRFKKQVSNFETMRPLSFLDFLITEPALVGCAEYGFLCRHDFSGNAEWNEKLWTNVGDMSVSGDGTSILLASFTYGIQLFDTAGNNRASYMADGTANLVAGSLIPQQIAAATLERKLYWLDSDGELQWMAEAPEEISRLICDPLGDGFYCGLSSGKVYRLAWNG
jgi:hypothetical protein